MSNKRRSFTVKEVQVYISKYNQMTRVYKSSHAQKELGISQSDLSRWKKWISKYGDKVTDDMLDDKLTVAAKKINGTYMIAAEARRKQAAEAREKPSVMRPTKVENEIFIIRRQLAYLTDNVNRLVKELL